VTDPYAPIRDATPRQICRSARLAGIAVVEVGEAVTAGCVHCRLHGVDRPKASLC
jgi:hypothetical protein